MTPTPTAAALPAAAIELDAVRTQVGDVVIHDDLDLTVHRGEILGVVGASGTGKSVLLRAIIGLQPIRAGRILVLGERVDGASRERRACVEQRWGVLFQDGALFSGLTVTENLQVPLREQLRLREPLLGELAALKLSLAGLPGAAGAKLPCELSPGMRKRAALARALALDPELLLLDEPTAGLDAIAAAAFDALLVELRDGLGLTVFLVTHDLDSLAQACDRVAVLAGRRVEHVGTYAQLLAAEHGWIRQLFHGPRARAVRPR